MDHHHNYAGIIKLFQQPADTKIHRQVTSIQIYKLIQNIAGSSEIPKICHSRSLSRMLRCWSLSAPDLCRIPLGHAQSWLCIVALSCIRIAYIWEKETGHHENNITRSDSKGSLTVHRHTRSCSPVGNPVLRPVGFMWNLNIRPHVPQ